MTTTPLPPTLYMLGVGLMATAQDVIDRCRDGFDPTTLQVRDRAGTVVATGAEIRYGENGDQDRIEWRIESAAETAYVTTPEGWVVMVLSNTRPEWIAAGTPWLVAQFGMHRDADGNYLVRHAVDQADGSQRLEFV